jgi:hypothetical protein
MNGWLFLGSTVVQLSTRYNKIKGSNPATDTGKEKILKKKLFLDENK